MSVSERHGPSVEIYCSSVTAPIWDSPIDAFEFNNKKVVVLLLSTNELGPHFES